MISSPYTYYLYATSLKHKLISSRYTDDQTSAIWLDKSAFWNDQLKVLVSEISSPQLLTLKTKMSSINWYLPEILISKYCYILNLLVRLR